MNQFALLGQEYIELERMIHDFKTATIYFAFLNICAFMAIVIDFILGIIRAKRESKQIQSHKIRLSFWKVVQSFSFIFVAFVLDLIFVMSDIYDKPYITMGATALVTLTEIKSWFESLDEKERAKLETSAKLLSRIAMFGGGVALGSLSHILSDIVESDGKVSPQSTPNTYENNQENEPSTDTNR